MVHSFGWRAAIKTGRYRALVRRIATSVRAIIFPASRFEFCPALPAEIDPH
jgi:hypothetical protein